MRLRLEGLALAAGVERVVLRLEEAPAGAEALDLFGRQRRRDPQAAARALARVRAELGDGAVVRAELTTACLPEAQARWVPLAGAGTRPAGGLPAAAVGPASGQGPPPLVRRLLARPATIAAPRPERVCGGPYQVSGGWWRSEVRRLYAFARAGGGELRWVFYDRRRRCWRLQGRVE
ncbi:MAG: hypothetical protein RBT60_14380 [Candidatus Krumholzibacteria bacterium]|nr:hypothetical protein [Candidatus Krumholzibacteria bacterium]